MQERKGVPDDCWVVEEEKKEVAGEWRVEADG